MHYLMILMPRAMNELQRPAGRWTERFCYVTWQFRSYWVTQQPAMHRRPSLGLAFIPSYWSNRNRKNSERRGLYRHHAWLDTPSQQHPPENGNERWNGAGERSQWSTPAAIFFDHKTVTHSPPSPELKVRRSCSSSRSIGLKWLLGGRPIRLSDFLLFFFIHNSQPEAPIQFQIIQTFDRF